MKKIVSKIKTAAAPVKHTEADESRDRDKKARSLPIPEPKVLEVREEESPTIKGSDGTEYTTVEVRGSNNKVYKLVVPHTYARLIPKTWVWDGKKYKAAELIAAGYPLTEVAEIAEVSRQVIYGWLQHPDFKEHVDGLTLETGWANKRERIAGLNRVTRMLFDKIVRELDGVKLTDKSIGAVLTGLQTIAKQIGQEKEEFVEQSKVESNVTGTMGVVAVNATEAYIQSKSAEERAQLAAEFNKVGDDLIRQLTGEKE
jgi:hypothetical protein